MLGTSRPVFAVDKVTAMINVTNAAGTTNGQTITVNGNVRTWTNAVFSSSTQILTNSAPGGAKTNMYNEFALNPFVSVVQVDAGSTNFQLIANAGVTLTVTLSAGWATVSYSTQAVSTAVAVRIPTSIEAAAQQTNINSGLLAAIRDPSDTNKWYESDPQMMNFDGLTNNQTIAGIKKLTNAANIYQGQVSNSPAISGNVGTVGTLGGLTNETYWTPTNVNPVFSNAVNYRNAFSSPSTALHAKQFGSTAVASAQGATALGYQATATGQFSQANGGGSIASGNGSTAVGEAALAQNTSDTAIGSFSQAKGTNSTALGANTIVANAHNNSTAIGYGATTTAANQIMLGGPGINAVVQNSLSVGAGATITAGVTNLLHAGTNNFPAGSDIAFGRYALSSLANGLNDDIILGTNTFVQVSGPSGAFTIRGINGSPNRDGKYLIILNRTGFNMTIAVEGGASGNDPVAANRIISMTGADRATTGDGCAILIYSGIESRWILISLDI